MCRQSISDCCIDRDQEHLPLYEHVINAECNIVPSLHEFVRYVDLIINNDRRWSPSRLPFQCGDVWTVDIFSDLHALYSHWAILDQILSKDVLEVLYCQ